MITGVSGFIGQNAIDYFLKRGHNSIIGIDRILPINCELDYKHQKIDLNDREILSRTLKGVSHILHLAGASAVGPSLDHPNTYYRDNVSATWSLLESVDYSTVKRIVIVSTCEVYGTTNKGLATENNPTNPQSPYAATKLAAEAFSRAAFYSFELPIVVARLFNTYGPFQQSDRLIPATISSLLRYNSATIVGDGKQTRDWIFVNDTVSGLYELLFHSQHDINGEIFNIGANNELSVLEVVDLLSTELGINDYQLKFQHSIPGGLHSSKGDTDKIRSALSWRPKHSFSSGLRETVRNFIGNHSCA